MEFALKINCDNAAFDDKPGYEVARILRELANKVEAGEETVTLFDINGNRVGKAEFKED